MKKPTKAQLAEYFAKAHDCLTEYGAIMLARNSNGTTDYNLPVMGGSVFVSVMDSWIHIRLPKELLHLAAGRLDKPNPFSGKWNIHEATLPDTLDELDLRLYILTKGLLS